MYLIHFHVKFHRFDSNSTTYNLSSAKDNSIERRDIGSAIEIKSTYYTRKKEGRREDRRGKEVIKRRRSGKADKSKSKDKKERRNG